MNSVISRVARSVVSGAPEYHRVAVAAAIDVAILLWCDSDVASTHGQVYVHRAVVAEGLKRGVWVGVRGAQGLAGVGGAVTSGVGERWRGPR